MDRNDELEFLKCDLENMIAGMTMCASILSPEERDHLDLHRRCLSVLERVKPLEEAEDAVSLDGVIDTIEWYRTNPQHFNENNLIEDMKGLPLVQPKVVPIAEIRFDDDKLHEIVEKQVKEMVETCEDAISRQAVLNTLEDMDKALDVDRTVENYKELLKTCYKELPPIQPKTKWIPFSERLPEAFVPVLRTVKSFGWNCTKHTYVDVGCICPIDKDTVLAWMPLPEPYKESKEKLEQGLDNADAPTLRSAT